MDNLLTFIIGVIVATALSWLSMHKKLKKCLGPHYGNFLKAAEFVRHQHSLMSRAVAFVGEAKVAAYLRDRGFTVQPYLAFSELAGKNYAVLVIDGHQQNEEAISAHLANHPEDGVVIYKKGHMNRAAILAGDTELDFANSLPRLGSNIKIMLEHVAAINGYR